MYLLIKNKYWITILCLFLFACGETSVNSLRQVSNTPHTFIANKNYQQIYKVLSTKARECLSVTLGLSSAQYVVDTDLYNELGEASITLRLEQAGYTGYFALIEIRKLSHLKTEVKIFTANSSWDYLRNITENWAKGYKSCK